MHHVRVNSLTAYPPPVPMRACLKSDLVSAPRRAADMTGEFRLKVVKRKASHSGCDSQPQSESQDWSAGADDRKRNRYGW